MQINRFFPLKLKKLFGILQKYLIINNILLYDIRIGGVHCTKNVIVTWMHSFPSIFLWFIYQNYEIIHADTRYCTLFNLGCSFITIRELCNNQRPRSKMWLHYFMLQIAHTTVFRVKRLNNLTLCIQLFNRLTRKTVV
jgi:hypothetical protein